MGALADELRHFANNLQVRSFKALSPGLGLGELRPPTAKRAELERMAATKVDDYYRYQSFSLDDEPAPVSNVAAAVAQTPPSEARLPKKKAAKAAPSHVNKAGLGMRILRRLAIWSCDLLMVCLSLIVALALAGIAQALQVGVASDAGHWVDLAVFKWVRERSILEGIAIVYGLFLAYGLTFRVAAGRTFGQALFASPKGESRGRKTASGVISVP